MVKEFSVKGFKQQLIFTNFYHTVHNHPFVGGFSLQRK